jgi:hypothetical protein
MHLFRWISIATFLAVTIPMTILGQSSPSQAHEFHREGGEEKPFWDMSSKWGLNFAGSRGETHGHNTNCK